MSTQKCEFQSKVLEKKPCALVMEVEIPTSQTDAEMVNVYQSIQASAKVPGFRAGKVPMDLVKKEYEGLAKEKLVEKMIQKTVFSALEKENFSPIDMPTVKDINFEEGKNLKYVFEAECHPEIKATDYKGIVVKKEKLNVTDANIDENIKIMLDRNSKLVISNDGIIKKDSFVIVNYQGFCDGAEIKEIKANDHMLDLGAENTLKGFKNLVGSKKGETKDIEIEYPGDYPNKVLAGKKVIFKTTVVEIKDKQLPELNDDFAKDMGLENLEDLKKKLKETIEQEEVKRQNTEVEKQIVEHLLNNNKFDVPVTIIAQQKEYLIKKMSDYMKNQGAPEDYIAKQVESNQEKYNDEADKNVRLSYILNSIYLTEKLEVSEQDLETEKQKMLDSNPTRKDDVEKYFNEHKNNISASMKEEKLFKFLLDNTKVTETEKDMPVKGN
jgi:trigger factor